MVHGIERDSSLPAKEIILRNKAEKITSVIVHGHEQLVNSKGVQLIGKTEAQIRQAYPKQVFEAYDAKVAGAVIYSLLIDYDQGIAFCFDPHTKNCTGVEVFLGVSCYLRSSSEAFSH